MFIAENRKPEKPARNSYARRKTKAKKDWMISFIRAIHSIYPGGGRSGLTPHHLLGRPQDLRGIEYQKYSAISVSRGQASDKHVAIVDECSSYARTFIFIKPHFFPLLSSGQPFDAVIIPSRESLVILIFAPWVIHSKSPTLPNPPTYR